MTQEDLKTPDEWCKLLGAYICDPDGWRGVHYRDWNDPISRKEFDERLIRCTIDASKYPTFFVLPSRGKGYLKDDLLK